MKSRVVLILALLIVVSVIITLNFFFYLSYESEMASQINRQQLTVVKTLAFSINESVKHFKEEVHGLAGLLSVRGLHKQGLDEFIGKSFEEISEDVRAHVVVVGTGDKLLYTSRPGYTLTAHDLEHIAKARTLGTDEIDVVRDEHKAEGIMFIAPIHRGGVNIGTVLVMLNMADITGKFLDPIKVGERGYAWIMDAEGTLLYHPSKPEMVGRSIRNQTSDCFNCHKSFKAEAQILGSPNTGFSTYVAPMGEDKILAFARVDVLGWVVCLTIPYSEVTASIRASMKLQSILIISILATTGLTAFIAFVINRERIKTVEKSHYADKLRLYANELEQIVKERTRELRSEKEKLNAVIESISAGICIFDNKLQSVWANKVMDAWTGGKARGSTLDGILGRSGELAFGNALIEDIHLQAVTKLDLGEKNGVFQLSLAPIHLPDGTPQLLMLLQDVTDLKMAEEQIMNTEKLAALSRLSAGVAHEIGNPLTSIFSYVQILREAEHDEFSRNALDTIYRHILRIDAILKKMSSFSRTREDEIGEYEVSDLVASTVDLVKFDKRAKGIDISVNVPSHLPKVRANGNQVVQVFMNLLLNAVDAMPDGGSINIGASSSNGDIRVAFADTGPGITPENMEKVFEPFFTTKASGTGLGLAVSRHLIRGFGGEIEAVSEPGRGSTFTVRLPVHVQK